MNHDTSFDPDRIHEIAPGNPDHPVTITINSNAWPAHQKHGDHEGSC
jgi:hypothetical protein